MQNPISTALGTVQNIEDLVRVHSQHGVVTTDSDAHVVEPNAVLALNVAELVPSTPAPAALRTTRSPPFFRISSAT